MTRGGIQPTRTAETRTRQGFRAHCVVAVTLMLGLMLSACSTDLQMKVSGNLNQLTGEQSIAILPVEVIDQDQKEAAKLFRQSLHANLKQSHFNLLEHYVVDELLQKNHLTDPGKYTGINPMHFGEVLGTDAVLISRMNRVERSYLFLHSSIELSVSVQMVDTRTGEILWRAEQTESDFQGIAKLPTGMAAAVIAPIYFVTNKLNLNRMTSKMVEKLTAFLRDPEQAEEGTTFEKTVIASAATRDIHKIEKVQKIKREWEEAKASRTESDSARQTRETNPQLKEMVMAQSAPMQAITPVNLMAEPEFKVRPAKLTNDFSLEVQNLIEKERRDALKKKARKASPTAAETTRVYKRSTFQKQNSAIQYTIQVGAYKTKQLAKNLLDALVEKGYNVFIRPFKKKETEMYRVQVETFADKKQARTMARKLKTEEQLQNFVTKVN